jgi:hypothetical protein
MVATLTTLVVPSAACGCGAYISESSYVDAETALVRIEGARETIVMSLRVQGTSPSAAWVMPVPGPARVSLGDPDVFEARARASAPRVVYVDSWIPRLGTGSQAGAPQPGAGVEVREHTVLGPFEVARLASDDPTALTGWLADNGFELQSDVAQRLAVYTDKGWEIVAAKLTASAAAELGDGDLEPLEMTFDTQTPVYPMLLSQGADVAQTVRIYLLGEHRFDVATAAVPGVLPQLGFAGRVDDPQLSAYTGGGTNYLTRFDQVLDTPSAIVGDYEFDTAATDSAYQEVVYVTRDRSWITVLALLTVAALIPVVLVIVAATLFLRRRRRAALPGR